MVVDSEELLSFQPFGIKTSTVVTDVITGEMETTSDYIPFPVRGTSSTASRSRRKANSTARRGLRGNCSTFRSPPTRTGACCSAAP